jgi:hypothetical protein
MSVTGWAGAPSHCSGAMYAGVPTPPGMVASGSVSTIGAARSATPKSASLLTP